MQTLLPSIFSVTTMSVQRRLSTEAIRRSSEVPPGLQGRCGVRGYLGDMTEPLRVLDARPARSTYGTNVLSTQFLRALNGPMMYPHAMERGSHQGLSKRN